MTNSTSRGLKVIGCAINTFLVTSVSSNRCVRLEGSSPASSEFDVSCVRQHACVSRVDLNSSSSNDTS